MKSLVIFAKAPVKGSVKTRLEKDIQIGEKKILELYMAFLLDILAMSRKTASDRIYLSCYPESEVPRMRGFVRKSLPDLENSNRFYIIPQEGENFDERFTDTVQKVLESSTNVVVIGSDSPHIQPDTINRAHKLLDRSGGIVVGPAGDGGVYLVGTTLPLDFKGIFSQGVEVDNLVSLAGEQKLQFFLLEELTDIDIGRDLVSFICTIRAMEHAGKTDGYWVPEYTIKTIREHGLTVKGSVGGERGRKLLKRGSGPFK